MRLYLSSFRTGAHPERLLELADGGRTALIPHALDGLPADVRAAGLARDLDDLSALGLDVTVVDLRRPGAPRSLADHDIVWVRGGNVFVLRRVLADTGADTVLVDLVRRDAVVYGGYSAGACVLAPDLAALALIDDPGAVPDPVTAGLALLDRPLVPHVRTPDHPESAACDALSAAYTAAGQPHWALRDGEVLLVHGERTELLPG
ncbi:Type 1 glutamine amidotransferase-like domain-containing protein [Plantactinospora sp. CA-290183]|uniref:Type 1 glutamine amidotransferase-like domain-containing protein n=1 Tax=Plantactinospora sp. CA-290183 TaxID=3240006 RepID=UPI003D8F8718